jgi:hypothetical protein
MEAAMRADTLPRLEDPSPTAAFETAKCPRCADALRFGTDWLGYAVEECHCGYSRRIVPVLAGDAPSRHVPPHALRVMARGTVQALVLAAIPVDKGRATSARELADATGLAIARVTCSLRHLKRRRLVNVRIAPRTAAVGRLEIARYWRAAA